MSQAVQTYTAPETNVHPIEMERTICSPLEGYKDGGEESWGD